MSNRSVRQILMDWDEALKQATKTSKVQVLSMKYPEDMRCVKKPGEPVTFKVEFVGDEDTDGV